MSVDAPQPSPMMSLRPRLSPADAKAIYFGEDCRYLSTPLTVDESAATHSSSREIAPCPSRSSEGCFMNLALRKAVPAG